MLKKIILKLTSIKYSGDSIGDDIRVEIKFFEKLFIFEQKIKLGTIFELDREIGRLETNNDIFEAPIRIKITEKDLIFSDTGEIYGSIKINTTSIELQRFNFQIEVQERNKIISKSTAIFLITLEAEVINPNHLELRPYNSRKSGENYNRFDTDIINAVNDWNNEFSKQDNPPPILLDPNLVKAMIYVESKMGYFETKKNAYPSYPDIMQVADPLNPAIYTLKNIFNPNPSVNKIATEYEIVNGEEILLEYKEINIIQHKDSIYWGIRWLYHKAQVNNNTNGIWSRSWRTWRQAVNKYNGKGDKKYENKVFNIYENGIGERNYKLWGSAFILLLVFVSGSFFIDNDKLDDLFIDFKDNRAVVIDTSYKPAKYIDLIDKALILNRTLYSSAYCKFAKDLWLAEDVLKNCTYTVGSNSSNLWSIKLSDGGYSWSPKYRDAEIIGHDSETDGPYYVAYEKSDIGDLNNDSRNDAVVVVRLNNGGNAMIRNIIVLVQDSDGEMEQYASYIIEDREEVEGLYINHGIISANVIIKSEDDPACCASVYDTYRFKITK